MSIKNFSGQNICFRVLFIVTLIFKSSCFPGKNAIERNYTISLRAITDWKKKFNYRKVELEYILKQLPLYLSLIQKDTFLMDSTIITACYVKQTHLHKIMTA